MKKTILFVFQVRMGLAVLSGIRPHPSNLHLKSRIESVALKPGDVLVILEDVGQQSISDEKVV